MAIERSTKITDVVAAEMIDCSEDLTVEQRMQAIDAMLIAEGYIRLEDAVWLLRTLQYGLSGLSCAGQLQGDWIIKRRGSSE